MIRTENSATSRLLNFFGEQAGEVLASTRWLVEQESMTRVPSATAAIAESYANQLEQAGARIELLNDSNWGKTVIARFERLAAGKPVPDSAASKQLLVVGHLDTVWPIGTLARRPFHIEEDRAYGPGIFDMKAGAALAIHSLRALFQLQLGTRRPTTLLFTCDEETGSPFSREAIEREARSAEAALILEPPIPGGILKTGRKGVGEFQVLIKGRPAHAGNDPRAGISAITELAQQIIRINDLADHGRGTTLNVGVVSGGVLSNVVAAEATASVDLRFSSEEEGARICAEMATLSPVVEGAQIEVRGGINRPPMVRTEATGRLFEHAREIGRELGLELQEGSVGGGSDGNFIAASGVPVLDGLGVDGAGAHAEHEHIIVSDIPRRAALLTRLIQSI